jgi:glyoxylase I family protein
MFSQVEEVGIMRKWCAFLLCFFGVAIGGCMNQKGSSEASSEASSNTSEAQSVILGLWGVRYQVKDVNRSIDFYTKQLGFKLDMQNPPAFAQVSVGNLKLILSGPGASGSRPMPDGRQQQPGGWNRVMLQVSGLPGRIEVLKKAGLHFRNEMEVGPGGKQILLEDPDGNPIELFEPAR